MPSKFGAMVKRVGRRNSLLSAPDSGSTSIIDGMPGTSHVNIIDDNSSNAESHAHKLGTFSGVFVPVILGIFGVVRSADISSSIGLCVTYPAHFANICVLDPVFANGIRRRTSWIC